MHLNPYLGFDGQCEEAFKFYETILGAKIVAMMTWNDTPMAEHMPPEARGRIVHARLTIDDQLLMGGDAPPGKFEPAKGFHVTLGIEKPAEAERVFNVLATGGTITMPLETTFWAEKFGMLVDKFGIPWMVNCEKPMA